MPSDIATRRAPSSRGPLMAGLATGAALLLAGALALVILPRVRGDDHAYLNGRYTSTYGSMYVRVDGEDVWMIYRWAGKSRIRGAVQDGTSVFASYTEGEGTEATGYVRFAIERSGASVRLEGRWGPSPSDLTSNWDARRLDGAIPADIAADLANTTIFPAPPSGRP